MKPNQSAEGTPTESQTPPSMGESVPGTPPTAGQERLTGVSEVADSVALTAGLGDAYAGFDPAVHATDKDGKPLLRKGGGLARKRGRKAGDAGTPAQAQTPAPVNQANSGDAKMSPDQCATFLLATTTAICHGVFGDPAWMIRDKAEWNGHHAAVKAYIEASGGLDLSPGWGLLATGVAYAVPRLDSPPTQTRIQKIAGWFRGKFGKKSSA